MGRLDQCRTWHSSVIGRARTFRLNSTARSCARCSSSSSSPTHPLPTDIITPSSPSDPLSPSSSDSSSIDSPRSFDSSPPLRLLNSIGGVSRSRTVPTSYTTRRLAVPDFAWHACRLVAQFVPVARYGGGVGSRVDFECTSCGSTLFAQCPDVT
eukprot:3932550-Rhodomonas_salina.1